MLERSIISIVPKNSDKTSVEAANYFNAVLDEIWDKGFGDELYKRVEECILFGSVTTDDEMPS